MVKRLLLGVLFAAIGLGWLPGKVPSSAPIIRDVQILTPRLARFERFELRFNLETSATHPDLPYDTAPPRGLERVSGVSADAIFYAPSGQVYMQPAFHFQPYQNAPQGDWDRLIPTGAADWRVRFSPQEEGMWGVRLRVRDAGGTSYHPGMDLLSFTVQGESEDFNIRRGFLRVARADPRYFEFSDGSAFLGAGFNAGFTSAARASQRLSEYGKNGVTLVRAWLSGAGINASQWNAWSSHHLPADGYIPGVSFETRDTYAGHDLAYRLDDQSPCLLQGWQQGPVAVEGGASYVLQVRVKVKGSGSFVVKTGDWLDKACAQPGNGRAITSSVKDSSDWNEVTGVVQTQPGQIWLDSLYLTLEGEGTALIDEVMLFRQDDPQRTNLLRRGQADVHLHFDPLLAARWDVIIASAQKSGVYLKLVSDEKNEWIRNHILPDGSWSLEADNGNFYAAPGTKVRWLQEAWWRYLIARWGYSPAIHSFEYVNEGDPYNGNHYEAAAAMAAYFDRYDPARHMVTTSFWHSFPNREFWSDPRYAAIDYADIHAYISTGWGAKNAGFSGDLTPEPGTSTNEAAAVRLDSTNRGSHIISPRGLVLREAGEWQVRYWIRAENLRLDCAAGEGVWLQWALDDGRAGRVTDDCAALTGTFGWRQESSDRQAAGAVDIQRLQVKSGAPVEVRLSIENQSVISGAVWVRQVQLVSPSGSVTPLIGQFDPTPFIVDPAWYGAAYGMLWGGASPVGAEKPLIRGESGIDIEGQQRHPDLNKDRDGVWLHDLVWAQLAPGGLIDLPWWAGETIAENPQTRRVPGLLPIYLGYAQFVRNLPLNNGHYRDAQARSSHPDLRAWGQVDRQEGRAYLWLQNRGYTWQDAVQGRLPSPVRGTLTISGLEDGSYLVEWWDTWKNAAPVFKTETVSVRGGQLILTLPQPLERDLAVKISKTAP